MHDFVYHNPTKVLFGRNALAQTGKEVCATGNRVLLLYGCRSAEKSGLLAEVSTLLESAGATIFPHGGICPNPTVEITRDIIEFAKTTGIDVVLGVGGGSVIDSAKAVAAGAVVSHDIWKFFTGKKSVRSPLPVVAIPTLAASGSEMNSGMVLTNTDKKQKFGFGHRLLHPQVAIMDPRLTYTVPKTHTAYGAIDAISHLFECYLTCNESGTTVQDHYMEGLANSILEACEKALESPTDYDARASLMWAAGLALGGLSTAGLGKIGFPMHLIEHSISALYDVPHGAGLAVVIPGWLRYQADLIPQRIGRLLSRLTLVDNDGQNSVTEAITALTDWFSRIGAPTTLAELGICKDDIAPLAENTQALAKIWRMQEYDKNKVRDILHHCL